MNRMVIAAVAAIAAIGSAGVASAQQAPQLFGDYSANVLNAYNGAETQNQVEIDFSSTAAITSPEGDQDAVTGPVFNWTNQNYSR